MIQAKTFVARGSTGVRFGQKETTLPVEVEKSLNRVLGELGDDVKSIHMSELGAALPDQVLVTVLYEAHDKKQAAKK